VLKIADTTRDASMTSEEVFVRGIEHRQRCRGDESLTSSNERQRRFQHPALHDPLPCHPSPVQLTGTVRSCLEPGPGGGKDREGRPISRFIRGALRLAQTLVLTG
jgi:hypothetical protein